MDGRVNKLVTVFAVAAPKTTSLWFFHPDGKKCAPDFASLAGPLWLIVRHTAY